MSAAASLPVQCRRQDITDRQLGHVRSVELCSLTVVLASHCPPFWQASTEEEFDGCCSQSPPMPVQLACEQQMLSTSACATSPSVSHLLCHVVDLAACLLEERGALAHCAAITCHRAVTHVA